ncbi:21906_t:CDS:2 [Dentiscutata erythropus]|uniref:21906_t:CDS:1 n=1 Tax=Dentiscutata erythropus TaxID=1348616 RepID=A0A9N8VPR0_9GLOM|nr:21906_t:CDS:2 [Dentiscutata erythropus]
MDWLFSILYRLDEDVCKSFHVMRIFVKYCLCGNIASVEIFPLLKKFWQRPGCQADGLQKAALKEYATTNAVRIFLASKSSKY